MPITDTKTYGECLRLARVSAGFATREQAQVSIHISNTCIGRHERGEKPATVDDAITYAQCYQAPDLLMEYCRRACPIGRHTGEPAHSRSVALLSVRLHNVLCSVSDQAERLMQIADDDTVDAAERTEFDNIVRQIASLRHIADELELYAVRLRGCRLGQTGAAAGKTTW